MGIKYNTCHASDHASDAVYDLLFPDVVCNIYILGTIKEVRYVESGALLNPP